MAEFLFIQNKIALAWGTAQWDIMAPVLFESRQDAIDLGDKIKKAYPRFVRDEAHENTHTWVYLSCRTVRPRANICIYANGNVVLTNVPGFKGTLVVE